MINALNLKITSMALLSTLVMTACGGGEDGGAPTVVPYKTEIFTGTLATNYEHCLYANGSLASARYGQIMRAIVRKDAIYIVDSTENCKNKNLSFGEPYTYSDVRKIENNTVNFYLNNDGYTGLVSLGEPTNVAKYLGGFHKFDGEGGLALAYVSASSDKGFVVEDEQLFNDFYNTDPWRPLNWHLYVPGLFAFAYVGDGLYLRAGSHAVPAMADGQGEDARFYAPHDLEANAAGLLYLIDRKRLRTIDQDYRVKTLDLAALGISGTPKTLDADQAGVVHALAQTAAGAYTWHRLSDGRKVAFKLPDAPTGETVETFTVVGDELLVAVRQAVAGSNASWLYRVDAKGGVARLTSTESLALPGTAANTTKSYVFPRVQHLEQGVDGYLYIVLEQGILRVKGYK